MALLVSLRFLAEVLTLDLQRLLTVLKSLPLLPLLNRLLIKSCLFHLMDYI